MDGEIKLKEMVEDIRTVSLNAMGTLIDLKRSLQEVYREICGVWATTRKRSAELFLHSQ